MLKNYYLLLCSFFTMIFAQAQSGNSLDFDGSNDYVTSNVPTMFNNVATQDFTIEARIKPSAFAVSRVFFVQTTNSNYVSILISSSGNLYAYISGTNNFTTATALNLNVWNHIAITRSVSSNTTMIYINGISQTLSDGGTTSTGTQNLMTLGSRTDGAQPFKGTMDEFRIWNTVRTGSQISANMNSTLTLPQTGLVAYYKFNQGIANGNNPTVTTLNDELNTTNGTLLNFALTGTTSNWVGTGTLAVKDIINASTFSVAPNPADNEIKISGLKQKTAYKIFNAAGQLVKAGNVEKENNSISVSELNTGVYFINLDDEKIKFIKK
ncbi:LamG-like jellyroll fold domain-containing protein [Chryseobacterium sp. MMS23-Vi53]|uniref:LamG-like jellyroll fold domain-containing protein n=1 Tax=Chryseobacterium sp. MMS23-Vi53 TaxID=3386644 RepID=UPI0039E9F5EB